MIRSGPLLLGLSALVLLVCAGIGLGPCNDHKTSRPPSAPMEEHVETGDPPPESTRGSVEERHGDPPTGNVSGSSTSTHGSLRIHVTSPEGRPLGGVRIAVMPEGSAGNSATGARGETDSEGVWVVEDLSEGRAAVSALLGCQCTQVPVEIVAGQVLPVELHMALGTSTVSGSVKQVDGSPVAKAVVTLTRRGAGGTVRYIVLSDEGGIYRIDAVAAGEYAATAQKPPQPALRTELRVPEGAEVVRDFTYGVVLLRGTVTDAASGQPVGGAVVRVQSKMDADRSATTDNRGEYSIEDLQPGDLDALIVTAKGYARVLRSDDRVDPAGTRLDFELERSARLVLIVTTSTGDPYRGKITVATVDLSVVRPAQAITCEMATDDGGRVLYEEVSPGRYLLEVRARSPAGGTASLEVDLGDGGNEVLVTLR